MTQPHPKAAFNADAVSFFKPSTLLLNAPASRHRVRVRSAYRRIVARYMHIRDGVQSRYFSELDFSITAKLADSQIRLIGTDREPID